MIQIVTIYYFTYAGVFKE